MENFNEEFEERGSAGNLLAVFISGAAVGAVAGILLAPRTGRESRERLQGYLRKTGDNLREFGQKAGQAFQKTASVAKDAFEEGRQAMRTEAETTHAGASNREGSS